MVAFPQQGGCVCGDVRYALAEDPIPVYACHCTDCQTETGSGFYLVVVVPAATDDDFLDIVRRWKAGAAARAS